jgi:hypothetical protein
MGREREKKGRRNGTNVFAIRHIEVKLERVRESDFRIDLRRSYRESRVHLTLRGVWCVVCVVCSVARKLL